MPLFPRESLEEIATLLVTVASATTYGNPVSLNNTIAVPLGSYAVGDVGAFVIKSNKMSATVVGGTYNAGTPVYLNITTPGSNVQNTGGGGFRLVGVCLRNYGTLTTGDTIEITFDGTPPKQN